MDMRTLSRLTALPLLLLTACGTSGNDTGGESTPEG